MSKDLLSVADLSRLLGIPEHRITYAHRTGRVDDATLRIAGRRIYTDEDVKRVAEYFNVTLDGKRGGDDV